MYCRPPKGYDNHQRFKGKIMKLKKALYGLAQAPRRWFDHMVSVLEKFGLTRTVVDPCLFVLIAGAFIPTTGFALFPPNWRVRYVDAQPKLSYGSLMSNLRYGNQHEHADGDSICRCR